MIKLNSLLIAAALTLTACARDSEGAKVTTTEASATASLDSEGNVVTREAKSSELEDLNKGRAIYDAIDAKFPKPQRPKDRPRAKAKAVSPTGEIRLEDGRTIVMDGVFCSGEGTEYLRRWLTGPTYFLVFEPTGVSSNGVVPANIWLVDDYDGGGEGESFPADAAITSGWCTPHKTRSSSLYDRYVALESAFAEERKRHAP